MPDIVLSDLPACDVQALAELPCAGTLILTVNNRLARRLTLDLAARLRAQRQVSELPRIVPLSAWLAAAADELAFEVDADLPAFRLGGFAAQLVWREAIAREEADRALLDIDQAARLAMDADMLCDEWRLDIPEAAQTDEYRGFARWRARYRAMLAELDADDANQGYLRVLRALRGGELAAPERIVLAGFGEVSPRFARLLAAFEDGGAQLRVWRETRAEPAEPVRVLSADHAQEWRAAAAWAAQRLRANPAGRYAIVSAQLENEAPFARRVLSQALQGGKGRPICPLTWRSADPCWSGRRCAPRWPGCRRWPTWRAAVRWRRPHSARHCWPGIARAIAASAMPLSMCAGVVRERSASASPNGKNAWSSVRGWPRVGKPRWRSGGLRRRARPAISGPVMCVKR
ncbi:probable DNA repair protein [Bordetella trematum]|nr:probable DNA repair protein [Bordetella trematum]